MRPPIAYPHESFAAGSRGAPVVRRDRKSSTGITKDTDKESGGSRLFHDQFESLHESGGERGEIREIERERKIEGPRSAKRPLNAEADEVKGQVPQSRSRHLLKKARHVGINLADDYAQSRSFQTQALHTAYRPQARTCHLWNNNKGYCRNLSACQYAHACEICWGTDHWSGICPTM